MRRRSWKMAKRSSTLDVVRISHIWLHWKGRPCWELRALPFHLINADYMRLILQTHRLGKPIAFLGQSKHNSLTGIMHLIYANDNAAPFSSSSSMLHSLCLECPARRHRSFWCGDLFILPVGIPELPHYRAFQLVHPKGTHWRGG